MKVNSIENIRACKTLRSPREIWIELEILCFKYKYKKFTEALWYSIPQEKVRDLNVSIPQGTVIHQSVEDKDMKMKSCFTTPFVNTLKKWLYLT